MTLEKVLVVAVVGIAGGIIGYTLCSEYKKRSCGHGYRASDGRWYITKETPAEYNARHERNVSNRKKQAYR